MRFKVDNVYHFCMEQGIYDTKDQAEAFNMGEFGFILAMSSRRNELGQETIKFIKQTYGEKVFQRLVDTKDNETFLDQDEQA